MSSSESNVVKQLKAVIEEDRRVIRLMQEEIDRLRFLAGLHSLKPVQVDSAPGTSPQSRSTQLHPGFLN